MCFFMMITDVSSHVVYGPTFCVVSWWQSRCYPTLKHILTYHCVSRLKHFINQIQSTVHNIKHNMSPIWGLRPEFHFCQTVEGLLIWGALFDETTGLSYTIAAGASAVNLPPSALRLTVSQSVSQSVSLGGSWPDIYYSLTVTVLFLWGILSDERTGLSFVYAAGPCQRSLSRVRLSQISDFPFRRLLRLAESRWRYSTSPPHEYNSLSRISAESRYIAFARTTHRKPSSIIALHWPHRKHLTLFLLSEFIGSLTVA
jgi:hypothetical protein